MIRRLNGEYISYINNRKISLKYIEDDIGEISINDLFIAKCPYLYTKAAIEQKENITHIKKVYVPDDQILFRELKLGTLINLSV